MSWLKHHLFCLGDRQLLTDKVNEYTYIDLYNQINTYTSCLDAHLKTGEVVGMIADYNFHAIALFLALIEKKAIIVPIVTQNTLETDKKLQVAGCDVTIKIDNGVIELDRSDSSVKHPLVLNLVTSGRSGLILFSSGSTGEPKAMIHDLDTLVESYKGKRLKDLNILVFLMFDHIGGLNTLLNILATGAFMVLPVSRNPNHVGCLIEEYQVHVLPTSPTFLNMMLMDKVNEKYDLSSLRIITYGTESMPKSLLEKLKKVFKKTKLVQTFGTSETGIIQTQSRSSESLEIKLDDPNIEHRIVNGELWLRSKTQILGYLNASNNSFTDDGWFQTGDLVEEKEDGYIQIIGRNKEVVNVGGLKVLPMEVESVLLEIAEVSDCMVYSEKSSITGQIVVADIVLNSEIPPGEARSIIRKFCRNKLDQYKVPVKINFTEKTNFNERFKKIRFKKDSDS